MTPHVRHQIERLVDAITEGIPVATLHDHLALLEDRRPQLDAVLSTAVTPAPRLHPNLADVYRQRVAELTRLLEADNAAEARGELAAILRMAQGAERARNAGGDADALAVQIKMVAGARNHLCRTRFRIPARQWRGRATTYVELGFVSRLDGSAGVQPTTVGSDVGRLLGGRLRRLCRGSRPEFPESLGWRRQAGKWRGSTRGGALKTYPTRSPVSGPKIFGRKASPDGGAAAEWAGSEVNR
jgi:hypothetical protein